MFKCLESRTSFPIYFHLFMFQRTINLVPTSSCHVSKESETYSLCSSHICGQKKIFVAHSEIKLCYIQSTFMSIAYLRIANWFSSVRYWQSTDLVIYCFTNKTLKQICSIKGGGWYPKTRKPAGSLVVVIFKGVCHSVSSLKSVKAIYCPLPSPIYFWQSENYFMKLLNADFQLPLRWLSWILKFVTLGFLVTPPKVIFFTVRWSRNWSCLR